MVQNRTQHGTLTVVYHDFIYGQNFRSWLYSWQHRWSHCLLISVCVCLIGPSCRLIGSRWRSWQEYIVSNISYLIQHILLIEPNIFTQHKRNNTKILYHNHRSYVDVSYFW